MVTLNEKEKGRETTLLGTWEILSNLVAEQKLELAELAIPLAFEDRKTLRDWYKGSKGFKEVFLEALDYELLPRTEEERKELNTHFAGRIFSDLAYLYISCQQQREMFSQILLSPERTLEFWSSLYPQAQKVRHPFKEDSLRHISVPDGVVVKEGDCGTNGDCRILAVCEYTLTREKIYFQNKYEGFKKDKGCFPALFHKAQLLFVVPGGFNFQDNKDLLRKNEISFLLLPVTHRQFRDFSLSLYENYRVGGDNEAASLKEIQDWAKRQKERTLRHLEEGRLTPEELNYLLKVYK